MAKDEVLDDFTRVERRLRREDYGSLLAIKLLPSDLRAAQIWLGGFFLDVAKIPYRVDEPLLGEIRMQWWRDSLAKTLRGERIGHPVADGLAPYLCKVGEPILPHLNSVIDSFSFEIQKTRIETVDEFYDIQRKRYGSLLKAGFLLSGLSLENKTHMIDEAGAAIGVTELLANLPKSLQRSIGGLPQEWLDSFDLTYEDFTSKSSDKSHQEKLRAALQELSGEAVVISWDIKKRIKNCSRIERAVLGKWLLVPRLLSTAIADRSFCIPAVSVSNPLSQVFMIWRSKWL